MVRNVFKTKIYSKGNVRKNAPSPFTPVNTRCLNPVEVRGNNKKRIRKYHFGCDASLPVDTNPGEIKVFAFFLGWDFLYQKCRLSCDPHYSTSQPLPGLPKLRMVSWKLNWLVVEPPI